MEQLTPIFTPADVARIIKRDYPLELFETVMEALEEYGSKPWHRESDRVRLAVLKISDGNMDELRRALEIAKQDYRDVLALAEYSAYLEYSDKEDRLTLVDREKAIEADWKEYYSWLKK